MIVDVEYGARKIIHCDSEEMANSLCSSLTYPNPKYEQATRYSAFEVRRIPKELYYFNRIDSTTVEVPRGVFLNGTGEYIKLDERHTVEVEYPYPFVHPLRKIQREAAKAYISYTRSMEHGDGTIVLQTGAGKSALGLYLAWKLKMKTLILVHKEDLVLGWMADVKKFLRLRHKQIGIYRGESRTVGAQVTIATIQTLQRLSDDEQDEFINQFGLVIVDEGHHIAASSYELIHNHYFGYYRLALTATDMRNDGLRDVITHYCGPVLYRGKDKDVEDAIIPPQDVIIMRKVSPAYWIAENTYTCVGKPMLELEDDDGNPINLTLMLGKGFKLQGLWEAKSGGSKKYLLSQIPEEYLEFLIRYKIIKKSPMDYNLCLRSVIESKAHNEMVVADVMQAVKEGRSCLVFCALKEHVDVLYDMMAKTSLKDTVQRFYGDSTDKKDDIRNRAESREKLVTIATYSIATEGTNVREWSHLFLASTVANELNLVQAIGRGRRQKKGKSKCYVTDYVMPNVDGMASHMHKRMKVYAKLGFTVRNEMGSKLSRRG